MKENIETFAVEKSKQTVKTYCQIFIDNSMSFLNNETITVENYCFGITNSLKNETQHNLN